jgi:hypothetical protein
MYLKSPSIALFSKFSLTQCEAPLLPPAQEWATGRGGCGVFFCSLSTLSFLLFFLPNLLCDHSLFTLVPPGSGWRGIRVSSSHGWPCILWGCPLWVRCPNDGSLHGLLWILKRYLLLQPSLHGCDSVTPQGSLPHPGDAPSGWYACVCECEDLFLWALAGSPLGQVPFRMIQTW